MDNAGTPQVPHEVLSYGYDKVGNVTRVADQTEATVGSTYDARDRLASRTWSGGGVAPALVEMGYDAAGRRASVDRFADPAGTQLVAHTVEVYDAAGRLNQRTTTGPACSVVVDYRYTFDQAGQLATESHHGDATTYAYDQAGQVVAAAHVSRPDEGYDHDPAGNPTESGQYIAAGNRVLSDAAFDYTYDDEGNRTDRATGAVTTFRYDSRNRLTGAVTVSAGGIVLSESHYTYDVFDRLIARDINGQKLVTVYDGSGPWADYDAAGNVAARYLYGDRADEILARWTPGAGQAWYLADRQGTIRDVIDPAGAVIGQREYDMGVRPHDFRQLLARARRDLYGFMNGTCGLVNPSNPCRRAKKTQAFIGRGYLDTACLQFTADRVERVRDGAPSRLDELQALADRQHAEVFRGHGFLPAVDQVAALRRLFDDPRAVGSSNRIPETGCHGRGGRPSNEVAAAGAAAYPEPRSRP